MTNKEKYREFCKTEKNIPIFSKDWWLDAVCPEKSFWDVILVEKGGQIVASMPYIIRRRHSFKKIEMPKLTQNLGPYIKYPANQKYDTKLSYEKEIMTEIIEKIPDVAFFNQNFNYSVTNWMPFFWNGFKQTTRYTFVIDNLKNINQVWNNFSSNTRKQIKKAEKQVKVFTSDDLSLFYKINKMSFERQNIVIPYTYSFIEKLDNNLKQRNCRKIFFAKDSQDNIHAAIYILCDENSAIYLMGGGNPELRNSGATSLLMWEAMKYASNITNKFDFEGSMIPHVEPFVRGFGGVPKPYFTITKTYSKFYKLICLGIEAINLLKN
jgi:hypothetical protein